MLEPRSHHDPVAELEAADEQVTAMVLHPVDLHHIELFKTQADGAGGYILGAGVAADPLGGVLQVRTLWRVPVVVTNSITVGKFLIGDFSKSIIADRMGAVVDVSEEHDKNFTYNLLTFRAEERLSLVVLDSGRSLRYGAF